MKYAKFSDDFLSYFRLDDNGETLVLTDKRGYTRAVKLLPYEERPQGEWVKVKEERMMVDMAGGLVTRYKCSECGRMIATLPSKLENYPFCHCGAEMRGAE